MWGKDQQFHPFFSSRHTWKHILIFFRLLFFKKTCFKFHLIAVLICYLYFIKYRRAHNVKCMKHYGGCLFFCCCWPWTWREMRPGLFQKNYAFCDGMLGCFQLSRSLVSLILTFLAIFCFNLYIGNFLTTIF